MLRNTDSHCDLRDEEQGIFPAHSKLYHLEPIGVSPPFVESLTRYIARLACAHSIQPNVLMAKAIVPQLDVSSQGRQPYARRTSFWASSAVLNSTTPLGGRLVQILEDVTVHYHLCFITRRRWTE